MKTAGATLPQAATQSVGSIDGATSCGDVRLFQHVSGTSDGRNQGGGKTFVDLGTQGSNMSIHDIGHWIIVDVPDMIDDRRASQHAILVTEEKFQERVLLIREHDFLPGSPCPSRSRIEL